MSTFTFDNEKFALKPVTYEGRQFSVICHGEAVLEAHGRLGLQYLFLYGRMNYGGFASLDRLRITEDGFGNAAMVTIGNCKAVTRPFLTSQYRGYLN